MACRLTARGILAAPVQDHAAVVASPLTAETRAFYSTPSRSKASRPQSRCATCPHRGPLLRLGRSTKHGGRAVSMNEFAGQATGCTGSKIPRSGLRISGLRACHHDLGVLRSVRRIRSTCPIAARTRSRRCPCCRPGPLRDRGRQATPTHCARRVRGLARKHGYDSVVATNYDLNQYADLRVGDLVTERCWVDHVSEAKSTGLGDGQFVTIGFSMVNQEGQQVGSVRARTFYYSANATQVPLRPQPGVDVLDEAESVEATRTLVIAAALASNDHEPVHHDHAVARQQGLRDIIVSIVTTAGLVCAHGHRRWGMGHPRFLQLRLAAPSFPGDVLTFSGECDPGAIVPQAVRVQAIHARGVHSMAVVAPQPAVPKKLSET